MKQFDYRQYLKNNPLLKESDDSKPKETNPMAKRRDITKKVIEALRGMQYDANYDATLQMIRANKKLDKGGTLVVWIGQSPEARLSAKNSLDVEITYIDVETTKKYFGLVKNQTKKAKDLSDSEGKDIDLGSTMDDIPMEQSVNKIVDIVKKAEQKVKSEQIKEEAPPKAATPPPVSAPPPSGPKNAPPRAAAPPPMPAKSNASQKASKFVGDNKMFVDKMKSAVGTDSKILASIMASIINTIVKDKKLPPNPNMNKAIQYLNTTAGEKTSSSNTKQAIPKAPPPPPSNK